MSNFYAEIHFLISEKTLKSQKAGRLKCFWLSLEESVCPCSSHTEQINHSKET